MCYLSGICSQRKIHPEQIIEVGNGTNDLEMLCNARLRIALNAKRYLREHATGGFYLPKFEVLY